jgi:hypothetical protein
MPNGLMVRPNSRPDLGKLAVIDATPAVGLTRPAPMHSVHSGTPAVERNKHSIALVGEQRNELLNRSYLLRRDA